MKADMSVLWTVSGGQKDTPIHANYEIMTLKNKLFLSILTALTAHTGLLAQRNAWTPSAHYTQMAADFELRHDIDSTTIVMLGNSLTEFGGNWGERLGVANVANYGIMGDNTQGMLHRLHQITPHHPQAIFLMVGINDVTDRLSDRQIFKRCRSVIEAIRSQSPTTRLFVQSLLPINLDVKQWKILVNQESKIVAINRRLADYCAQEHLPFIHLYPLFIDNGRDIMRQDLTIDGLHLTEQGYQIWVHTLRPYLDQLHTQPIPHTDAPLQADSVAQNDKHY